MTQAGRNWEHIFQAIGHPTVILDPRHRIVDANQAVLRASGLSREELIGRKCHEIFHGPDCGFPPECCPMESVLASGRLETVEGEMEAFGGIFLVSCTPVPDQKGRVKEIIHIATDIGERKRMEEEQRRARETAERLAEEMRIIAEIGRLIGSTLDIDEVYERFAAEARKLIPFDRLAVNLCDHEKNVLCVAYVFGEGIPGRKRGDAFPLAGTWSELIIQKRTGIILQGESLVEILDRIPALIPTYQSGFRSLLSVPLFSRGGVIGVLHFRTKEADAYAGDDLRLAERIGEQIAGAIANAQLFSERKRMEEEIREMSFRDEMTELYNRRGFVTMAEQQLKAANRAGRPMRLTFIDCDGLKRINDTLGHETGNRVLVETADILRQTFRESDIIARMGGDEFAVLAIETADLGPEVFSERLQQNIDRLNSAASRSHWLSLSWGTALYDPASPVSLDQLMSAADGLMYAQKNGKCAGRD